jgi:hypothetical protein
MTVRETAIRRRPERAAGAAMTSPGMLRTEAYTLV